jgi:vacuolar iron transporter family protein
MDNEHAPDGAPGGAPDIDAHPAAVDHGAASGGWLRPAVFGVSDGLVSNLALVLGVAAGHASGSMVFLVGVSGLLAGSFSMAAGEWISVQAQRETLERELQMEADHIRDYPEEEAEHMRQILTDAGVKPELVSHLVEDLSERPEANFAFHARVELGINPEEMDSPWVAAYSSFLAFALGAFVPLVPWIVADGAPAWAGSIGAGGLALFLVGALLARFTVRSWWASGARQLAVGALAAGVTTLIGSLIGG